jgi:hypothetical protein
MTLWIKRSPKLGERASEIQVGTTRGTPGNMPIYLLGTLRGTPGNAQKAFGERGGCVRREHPPFPTPPPVDNQRYF